MNSRVLRRVSDVTESTIDVTPVMNMFVILIPFLISMAVFTQLGTHRFFLPGNDGSDIAQKLEDLPLIVNLDTNRIMASVGDVTLMEAGPDETLEDRFRQLNDVLLAARAQVRAERGQTSGTSNGADASSGARPGSTAASETLSDPDAEEPGSGATTPPEPRVVIATGARVPVQDVVRCLDLCRSAGWTNLGLAESTGDSK